MGSCGSSAPEAWLQAPPSFFVGVNLRDPSAPPLLSGGQSQFVAVRKIFNAG